MTEIKETRVTFTFKDNGDGRYRLNLEGDEPDTGQTYILWVKCMEVLLSSQDLGEDKEKFIRSVYERVMAPSEKVLSSMEKAPLRIVTIYSNPQNEKEFAAVEFHAGSGTAVRTGWVVYGEYEAVIAAMEDTFGPLVKIPKDESDPPTVVENWI
jgi:hypothetical protein